MMPRSNTFNLGRYPRDYVRLACSRCSRKGQYRKETLIAEYGGDVRLPDLLVMIAKCERRGNASDPCGVVYSNLLGQG